MKRRGESVSNLERRSDRLAKKAKSAEPGALYSFARSFRYVGNKPTPQLKKHGLVPQDGGALEEHHALEPLPLENDVMREGHEEQSSTLRAPALTVGACTWNAQRFGMPTTPKQIRERDHVVHCLHWMFDANPWLDFVGIQEMSNVNALRQRMTAAHPINFQVLHDGPFLFSCKKDGTVGSMEWYPLLARADTRWRVANVYTHSYHRRLGNQIHACTLDPGDGEAPVTTTDGAFWWEKGRVFRPVIVYHLRHLDTGAELKIGAVHTTPKGKELHRPEDFHQILPVIEYMEQHPDEHWILLGDFYLPPEAVVKEIKDVSGPFVAEAHKRLGYAPKELFDRSTPLSTDRLVRLLFDEDARLLGLLESKQLVQRRPSGYRSYVLSGLEYRAAWVALGRLASWLHEGGDATAAIDHWLGSGYPASSIVDFMRLFQDEAQTVRSMTLVDEEALRDAEMDEEEDGEDAQMRVEEEERAPVTDYDQVTPVLRFMRSVLMRACGDNYAASSMLLARAMGDWNENEVHDLEGAYRHAFGDRDPLLWDAMLAWGTQNAERERGLEDWFAKHLGMAARHIDRVAARVEKGDRGEVDDEEDTEAQHEAKEYREIRLGKALEPRPTPIDRDDATPLEPPWYANAQEDRIVGPGEINAGLDQLEGKASRRVLEERVPRIVGKKDDDDASDGLDPRHYPIEPAPDVRRFRQTFWLSFERELAARGLEIVAPVSATNLKSIHSIRLGLHTSARLADFAVTHKGAWNVKAVGIMSPELSAGTGGLVTADTDGLWVLWCWLHLSDHAPTGFFLSTQKKEEARARFILEGLGRALDQQLEAQKKKPHRQRAYRALRRERMWRELVKLSQPCLDVQRTVAKAPGEALKRLTVIATCADPEGQDLAKSFEEMTASDALFAWLEKLARPVFLMMTATELPYRDQVVRLARLVLDALAERRDALGSLEEYGMTGVAMTDAFRVLERVARTLEETDIATVEAAIGALFLQARDEIGTDHVATPSGFGGWAASWLGIFLDTAEQAPHLAALAAEMDFLFRALGWLLTDLERRRSEDRQAEDEWIAQVYPDARVRRGPGRYKPQEWMGGKSTHSDDEPPPPPDGEPSPEGRDDLPDLPREGRDAPPRDDPGGRERRDDGPPDRGTPPSNDPQRDDILLPGPYDLEALFGMGGVPEQPRSPQLPMPRQQLGLQLELDEAWIPRLGTFEARSVTPFGDAVGKLRVRGHAMTLGWVGVAKQTSRINCGFHAMFNAAQLGIVGHGMTPMQWQQVFATLAEPELSAMQDELGATLEQSQGLDFQQVGSVLPKYAPSAKLLPPFQETSCILQYNDVDIGDIVESVGALARAPGAFVLIGGSQNPPHWRAAIVHRFTHEQKPCWEIIVADSECNPVFSREWAQQLSDWIDDPEQVHRDSVRTDGGGTDQAQYGFQMKVVAAQLYDDLDDDYDPTFYVDGQEEDEQPIEEEQDGSQENGETIQ